MPLGDGFFMRHGAGVENTWYNPGYWHTGEDWYAVEGDTAGARVYAIAAGEVLYVGSNYPGRVVILRHAEELYSMYGHLDPRVAVRVGDQVGRAALLGTVLRRSDTTPSHLHFEVRTFLIAPAVNGDSPRYGFRCGANCPPGPGYWPIAAPDLPSDLGWRTPTHVIAGRMFAVEAQRPPGPLGEVVVATSPISPTAPLWSAPPDDPARSMIGVVDLTPGAHLTLLAVRAGAEDTRVTSALAYQLWYQIELPNGGVGWVQAAIPSAADTGGDGRPSSIFFNLFPAIPAP
jgi:Peptidase family M23